MLEKREVNPPSDVLQLQIARVGEARVVAHTMMMQGDLQAMDRLLELNGELDRYHGFGRARLAASAKPAPLRVVPPPRALLKASSVEGEENFPPRKAWKSRETRKSSARASPAGEARGFCRSGSRHPGRAGAASVRADLVARDLDVDLQRRDRAGALQLHR
jgi:hypothetical protein